MLKPGDVKAILAWHMKPCECVHFAANLALKLETGKAKSLGEIASRHPAGHRRWPLRLLAEVQNVGKVFATRRCSLSFEESRSGRRPICGKMDIPTLLKVPPDAIMARKFRGA